MRRARTVALCAALATACATSDHAGPCAHAHNDYQHARPLHDALDAGACSVEADVHLVNGELLVAHDPWQVQRERTLQALYLKPLRTRAPQHRRELVLLVDVKTHAAATYRKLREVLASYRDLLTVFAERGVRRGAVTVIVSGNRARDLIEDEDERLVALDGRLEDLDGDAPPSLIPWISESWSRLSRWRGDGPMPERDRARLRDVVARAHAQGRKLRLWATPDDERVWRELVAAGVDLINADDLARVRRFLEAGER